MLRTMVILLDFAFLLFLLYTFCASPSLNSEGRWALVLYAWMLVLNLLVLF
jgi:hypothetical protein